MLIAVPAVGRIGIWHHRCHDHQSGIRFHGKDGIGNFLDLLLFVCRRHTGIIHTVRNRKQIASVLLNVGFDIGVEIVNSVLRGPTADGSIDVGNGSALTEPAVFRHTGNIGKLGINVSDRIAIVFCQVLYSHLRPGRCIRFTTDLRRGIGTEGNAVTVENHRGILALFQF